MENYIEYLRVLILGAVQGVTEFLPISSDGHLVVVDNLFRAFSHQEPPKESLVVTILLHLGTLLAILIVYRQAIWKVITRDHRMIGLLIVGTIPAAVVGLLLDKFLDEYLTDPLVTGCLMPINGLMLLWIGRKRQGDIGYEQITLRQALIIGACQAFAPLPGISRSGTTIAGGLAVGLRREAAATFSFLLAIPAIGGAGALGVTKLLKDGAADLPPTGALVAGTTVAFIVGWLSLLLLLRLLREGWLDPLAWWCIALGIGVVIWQLAG